MTERLKKVTEAPGEGEHIGLENVQTGPWLLIALS